MPQKGAFFSFLLFFEWRSIRSVNDFFFLIAKHCIIKLNKKGGYVKMRPKQSIFIHILLALCTGGLGNIVYFFVVRGKQKQWDSMRGSSNFQQQQQQQVVNVIVPESIKSTE